MEQRAWLAAPPTSSVNWEADNTILSLSAPKNALLGESTDFVRAHDAPPAA